MKNLIYFNKKKNEKKVIPGEEPIIESLFILIYLKIFQLQIISQLKIYKNC